MGLGKTRQAIIALHVAEPGGPYLVVCPASVKRNWAREIEAALPDARVQIMAGKGDVAPLEAEWVVVNYDILSAHAQRLAAHGWLGVVFDETHYVKNHQSQRSKQARAIVAAVSDPVVYALTGTPLTNRPRDLFPLLQLCQHALGKSFLSFAKRYCAAYENDYTVRVFVANIIAGRRRPESHRGSPRRLQRPRLGARQPLAGGRPRVPHRPDEYGARDVHSGR